MNIPKKNNSNMKKEKADYPQEILLKTADSNQPTMKHININTTISSTKHLMNLIQDIKANKIPL